MRLEMRLRLLDRTRPDETEIAVAWPYRERRNIARDIYPWSVHIQLRIAQAKRDPRWCPMRNDLSTEYVSIEPCRPLPVRHSDDSVIDLAASHRSDDRIGVDTASQGSACGNFSRATPEP
jgi:hypothetical protein